MKRKQVAGIFGLLLGTLLLCTACGGKEQDDAAGEEVREERTVEKKEEDEKKESDKKENGKGENGKGENGKAEPEGSGQAEKTEDGRDELLEMLLKESGATEDKLQIFEYDDYDKDGTYEAFALIGEQMEDYGDEPVVEGALWFVSEDKCELLREAAGIGYRDTARIMEIGGTKYVMFDEVYITQAVTGVWYVSDGAKEAKFSGCGYVVESTEEDRFCIVNSSYDAFIDPAIGTPSGHTWKYYYFFYNSEEGEVNEYAGTTIDADTVTFLCGRDLLAEILSDGDVIDSIFCRGNGHIVINYEYNDAGGITFEHYIYDFSDGYYVDDSGQELTEPEAQSGICARTICPGIASYPEVPGPGDLVWYGE